jgi:hypothetical protein
MTSIASLRCFFPISHRVYSPDTRLHATTQNFERAGFRAGAVLGEACAFVPRLAVGLDVRLDGRIAEGRQPLRASGLLGLVQYGLSGGASILGTVVGCALGLVSLPVALLRTRPLGPHVHQAMVVGAQLGARLVATPVQVIEGVRVVGAFALGLATLLVAHCGAVFGAALSELFIERPRALAA